MLAHIYIFYSEQNSSIFLRNVGRHLPDCSVTEFVHGIAVLIVPPAVTNDFSLKF